FSCCLFRCDMIPVPRGNDNRANSDVRIGPVQPAPAVVAPAMRRVRANPIVRAGSIITRKNLNLPLAAVVDNDNEDENDDREIWTVGDVVGHGWVGNTLLHEIMWECNGKKSWEPLHHLNCFDLVVAYYKRINEPVWAKMMEAYHHMQPTGLRMHVKNTNFLFYTRTGMLNDAWVQRSFVYTHFDAAEVADKLGDLNYSIRDLLRCKRRAEGGAEFEVVNRKDGCVPPLPFGRSIEEAEETADHVVRPDWSAALNAGPTQRWLPTESGRDSNEHDLLRHAPATGMRQHAFIPTLVYRNRYSEWDLRPTIDLNAGKKILRIEGQVVSRDVADKYLRREGCEITAFLHFIRIDDATCLDRREHMDYSRYLAHSCEPNCDVRLEQVDGAPPALYVHAKRDIEAGEALSINYFPAVPQSVGEAKKLADFIECQCGLAACRGVLWIQKGSSAKSTRLMKMKTHFGGHSLF
ncbi:hypothetical protein PFISCL1PPCAC_12492, partial [Pristionchus fissidentatus]